jgi:hypothetical protein
MIQMEAPITRPGVPATPSPREMELEAESFAALYAQVNSG